MVVFFRFSSFADVAKFVLTVPGRYLEVLDYR